MKARPDRILPFFAACALALWLLSVLCHDLGTGLSQVYFSWAETPGILHPQGGRDGFVAGERLLQGLFAAVLVGLLAVAVWRLRSYPRQRLAVAAVPWLVWLALVYAAWTAFIVFASELVHFVQYGLIGALVGLAINGGRRPQAALLVTVMLGFVDELWQHYVLHGWWLENPLHWFDWSDPLLDALGACGGILPLTSRAWLRREPPLAASGLMGWAVGAMGLLLLPLLLLDPVETARLMGHYITYPTWNEFANGKPVYRPQPRQGIPLFLGAVLILGMVVQGSRRALSMGTLAIVAGLLALALDPPSRRRGQPPHEVVASTRVPQVGDGGIVIDGVLDEPAWKQTPRLGPFVGLLNGESQMATSWEGREMMRPLQGTYARLLWDTRALYVGFEVEDKDVWARPVGRDQVHYGSDELVAVLIDDGGEEVTYYAFEVTSANVMSDGFFFIPAAPVDYNVWSKSNGLPQWDARSVQTAVQYDGTLDLIESWRTGPAMDRDRGYVVEMVIPWDNFQLSATPGGQSVRQSPGPGNGEQWRMGLFRTEYYRLDPAAAADSALVEIGAASRRLGLTQEEMITLVRQGNVPPATADSTFLFRRDVAWRDIGQVSEIQAWTPTYIADLHRPPFFGVVEFVEALERGKSGD